MTTNKTVTIADTQLLSGNGDVTRDALGLSIDGKLSEVIEEFVVSPPLSFIDGIKTGFEYSYRMIGSELVENDKHWLSFIYGGIYSDETFDGVFINDTFFDHHHVELNPYSEIETRLNGSFDKRSPNYISCKPEIKNYYRIYTNSLQPSTDITTIPNGYLISGSLPENIVKDYQLNTIETGQINSQLRNIFVTSNDAFEQIKESNQLFNVLPHYVKTSFDFDTSGNFVKQLGQNNFQHRFIKILKDSFLSEEGAPPPANVNFNLNIEQLGVNTQPETVTANSQLKVVDIFDLMDYSLKNYNTSEPNFQYLFDNSEMAQSQYDDKSVRRYEKTIPTLKQTNNLINLLNSELFLSTFQNDPLNLQQKYNEVIAYRIEKIGGMVTGDRFTQDAAQNFWFLNAEDVERFEFLDSQVIFNQDYTYNVYKYVLIAGLEYTYSDLSLTRTIAKLDPNWCLEFFNPQTGDSSSPVYDDGPGGVEALGNTLASDAQVTSEQQYLADFKLRVLPSVKIVEVPLLSKQISIVDSPTNSVQVMPSYTLDDSSRLIFKVRYAAKVPFKMPTAVTSDDAQYVEKYLTSYDVLNDDLITNESATLPINLQVFRIEQKPTSLADFDGNLYKTISMKILNENQTFRTLTIADKVLPNKKYFYFFRIVNEGENFGAGSNIIQAELVSDGGYKFANFEAFFENELSVPPPSETIKSFKKLINISPSISNLIVDHTAVDYSDSAENQIQNVSFGTSENVIWDKKYKIRLTSKKTGKKIDINITHKLNG